MNQIGRSAPPVPMHDPRLQWASRNGSPAPPADQPRLLATVPSFWRRALHCHCTAAPRRDCCCQTGCCTVLLLVAANLKIGMQIAEAKGGGTAAQKAARMPCHAMPSHPMLTKRRPAVA
ncbi:hypothetical protein L207DRAFT_343828 [Hyaloscypha variabilis F]|uniref:Uncharacterized protein n=1 Tax=Hyaloscypha variabilis (strain UAMH 11265 / GT02V1 / F) TaxID=1149755 RepID=A0A2J6RQD1_HYAVF|nr:hypothetical protein L207DRAFT_343828 [Hyaloscypha variabilis F]